MLHTPKPEHFAWRSGAISGIRPLVLWAVGRAVARHKARAKAMERSESNQPMKLFTF